MIRAVYKGIMKAVDRRLTQRMRSDFEKEKALPYEGYLLLAESYAQDELCKAFRVRGGLAEASDIEALKGFAEYTIRQMGMPPDILSVKEDAAYIRMPNRVWRLTASPMGLRTADTAVPQGSAVIAPCRHLYVILPDLDRMMPVLERMTRNILIETANKDQQEKMACKSKWK